MNKTVRVIGIQEYSRDLSALDLISNLNSSLSEMRSQIESKVYFKI